VRSVALVKPVTASPPIDAATPRQPPASPAAPANQAEPQRSWELSDIWHPRRAVEKGLVASAHDCSEGGLGVALAEMSFAGGMGITVSLNDVPFAGTEKRDDTLLFSESNSRFVVELEPSCREEFEEIFAGVPHAAIGRVEKTRDFTVLGLKGEPCVFTDIESLRKAWKGPLAW